MTFCLAMKLKEGLVALSDTRVTSGAEQTTARKVTLHENGRHSMFLMTSGLRSVRDKAVTYFNEVLEEGDPNFDRLYKAVNAFSDQIRRVAREDKAALEESGLEFNLNAIVGGQLEGDRDHKLYLIYPQANWVEVSEGTPYYVIGESSYGKPLLDRCLTYETTLSQALKIGYLAFDAARTAATDVGFPLDVVLYRHGSFKMCEHRYQRADLIHVSRWWHARLLADVEEIPSDWLEVVVSQLPGK